MAKTTDYIAKAPDEHGVIHYTNEENAVWQQLLARQMHNMPGNACNEYLVGLETLGLPPDRIPQLGEINKVLADTSGWSVARVPALINFETFFKLLSAKRFPVATFIRRPEELDYLQEPDIFHEIFGHCPLLTNPFFAEFTHQYGKLGRDATPQERVVLARLYWFTVEFGLLDTPEGMKIYGGGILSSPGETKYALHSDIPKRRPFDLLEVLRTPYRIDEMQTLYYILNSVDDLYAISQMDIMNYVHQAMAMGLLPDHHDKQSMTAC